MSTIGADIQTLTAALQGRAFKVIGLGGIGSPVAQAMAHFLGAGASAGAPPGSVLYLVDGDVYEEKNRARVAFHGGGNKAISKAHELTLTCAGAVTIIPIPKYVTPHTVHRVIEEREVVFLAVDNHATRRSVSNRCRRLRDVLLISGGNDGIEAGREGTFGNVLIYERVSGRDVTSPLTRYHPEIAKPRDKRPDEAGCMALAESAPQLLFTNLAVAAAMLGAFYAWLSGRAVWDEVFLDIGHASMRGVRRRVPGAPERV